MAKTFSPKRVSVSVNGAIITGFADGTFVSIEMNSDAFTKVVGADGEVARSASADESGQITITLLQTSASNKILNDFHNADRLSLNGQGSVSIVDTNGTTLVAGADAWVKKHAVVEFGKEIVGREWVIDVGRLVVNQGGNL